MRTMQFKLSDKLVQDLDELGWLTDEGIQEVLEEAVRQDAVRKQGFERIFEICKILHAAKIPRKTEDELVEEIWALREKRRACGE